MYHQTNPTELFRERQLALLAEAENRRLLARRVRARRAPEATRTIAANLSYLLAALAVAGLLALIALAAEPAHAALPGTNGKIFFHSYRKNNDDIYSMNPNGTGLQRLTKNPAWDGDPVVSSAGKKIAFESYRDGNKEIYIMNADGSNQKRLTYNAAYDEDPTFSPDGTKIAFVSDRSTGDRNIWVMNADASGAPIMLTADPASDSDPAFSPDGTKIAFASRRNSPRDAIYTMNASPENNSTNVPKRLTFNSAASDSSPSFSPDGTRIVFASSVLSPDIYVMNADGSNLKPLTSNSQNDESPVFSPDGKKIAFHSTRNITPRIYKMNADGSNQKPVSNRSGYTPDWGSKP